jgi:creatinine amidohydrolase
MPGTVPSRIIGELTFQDITRLLGERSILCLPIGSIEQHGPHLPLNTDVVLAEEFTRRIIDRWGDALDLWQLPTLSVSLAREHQWAAGTLSLSVAGMTTLMHDLGREIACALPARNLAIINGHGGNRGILEALIHDLRADFGLNVCVLHPAAWVQDNPDKGIADIHGGKSETAMMLAAAPYLVRRDRIAELSHPPEREDIRTTILTRGVSWPWTTNDKRITDTGVIGDAQAATAEQGQRMFEHIAEQAGDVLRQLASRQQPPRR